MSSNVGLSTPRGSGTSGYVQRNSAFMKPRNTGYGAPYPPVAGAGAALDAGKPFRQRMPDRQILEHDRRREIEVRVMEERERLEEENEEIEEMRGKKGGEDGEVDESGDGDGDGDGEGKRRVLSEEEIDERCEVLRARLLRELDEDDFSRGGRSGPADGRKDGNKGRKQFKAYQVHELAEAKIEESERLRRALGIREDKETGEISSSRGYPAFEKRRERERY
ncbi:hypothetical protein P168DRAFT_303076 [Aspergillus campestris IBT 28561]|uniref:CWF21 domain-containing protein n=1 Tax=Aspergillus campestris (strain IBT 28561) TaxID=1392248 RepID=A0A2I1DAB0_ASPC2|nr:uncharacterized protein P168DRAFT_303076 [Aspergillus campestris IBT 28561]PKY06817.1 hypothetical protein P168DRAFT_303076 [Aspergillus campestris IBT 28561]